MLQWINKWLLGGECANSFSLASKETFQNKDCCYVFFFFDVVKDCCLLKMGNQ